MMVSVSVRYGISVYVNIFVFKQKTAYEMRISDWSSDVCSADLTEAGDDLVEDEDAPLSGGELAEPLEEGLVGQEGSDVVRNRFEDDRGDLVGVSLVQSPHRVEIVELRDERRVQGVVEDAGRQRIARVGALGGRCDVGGDSVVPPVDASLEIPQVLRSEEHTSELQSLMRISY